MYPAYTECCLVAFCVGILTQNEALPGVLGNRGTRAFISGEQGSKGQILRGTGEQRQYWGAGNIENQIFDIWGTGEQANLFQGNKGTRTPPPGRASKMLSGWRFVYGSILYPYIAWWYLRQSKRGQIRALVKRSFQGLRLCRIEKLMVCMAGCM